MKIFVYLFTMFTVLSLFDCIMYLIPGLIMVRFPDWRRMGVKLLGYSIIGGHLCPRYCPGPCDATCPIWTCPHFHSCMPNK